MNSSSNPSVILMLEEKHWDNRRCYWHILKVYNSVFIPKPVDNVETSCSGTSFNRGFKERNLQLGVRLISLSLEMNHSQLPHVAFALSPQLRNSEQFRFWAKEEDDDKTDKKRSQRLQFMSAIIYNDSRQLDTISLITGFLQKFVLGEWAMKIKNTPLQFPLLSVGPGSNSFWLGQVEPLGACN